MSVQPKSLVRFSLEDGIRRFCWHRQRIRPGDQILVSPTQKTQQQQRTMANPVQTQPLPNDISTLMSTTGPSTITGL